MVRRRHGGTLRTGRARRAVTRRKGLAFSRGEKVIPPYIFVALESGPHRPQADCPELMTSVEFTLDEVAGAPAHGPRRLR
jgi:hypothetical protein